MKRALLVSLIVVVLLVSTILITQFLLPQFTRKLPGRNTGVVGTNPRVYGNLITFHTREQDVGVDLNRDGDESDHVVSYYDVLRGNATNTGIAGANPSIHENIIAFSTAEHWVDQDLNGDGYVMMGAMVIRYYDVSNGILKNTGLVGDNPSIYKNIIALNLPEEWVGLDLNSDGDEEDTVILYHDILTGELTNTGAAGANPSVYGNLIAFQTSEEWVEEDLNGDGDVSEDEYMVRLYNMTDGTLKNVAVGGFPSIFGDTVAFHTAEWLAWQDLNGDGDKRDYVIRYYDMSTGTLKNTGAIGNLPSVYGDRIAFFTLEKDVEKDLNGDGDKYDCVVHYYDTSSGTLENTLAVGLNPSIHGNVICFQSVEGQVGQDLNGDGDIWDTVIGYYETAD